MDGTNNSNLTPYQPQYNDVQPHQYLNDTGFEDQPFNQEPQLPQQSQQLDVPMEGEEDEDFDYGDDDDIQDNDHQLDKIHVPPPSQNIGGSIKISIPFFTSGTTQIKSVEQSITSNQVIQPSIIQSQVFESISIPQLEQPTQKIKISLPLPQQQIPQQQHLMNGDANSQAEQLAYQNSQHQPISSQQPVKIVLGGLKNQVPTQITNPITVESTQQSFQAPPAVNAEQLNQKTQANLISDNQMALVDQSQSLFPVSFEGAGQFQVPNNILPSPIVVDQLQQSQLQLQQQYSSLNQPLTELPQVPLYEAQQYQAVGATNNAIGFEDQQMMGEMPVRKKEKKEKRKKIKVKRDMREFYEATKIKVTLEIDPVEKRARGQTIFIFKLKPEEDLAPTFQQMKNEDCYKKIQIDLRFHSKKLDIAKVSILRKEPKETEQMSQNQGPLDDLMFDYPHPQTEQTKFQGEKYGNISHDLFSLEHHQKLQYQSEKDQLLLLVHNIQSISFKKENLYQQLEKEIRIVVIYYISSLQDFGIQSVNYKKFDNLGAVNSLDSIGTYFHTSDRFDTQHLWMPLIHGTYNYPMDWSFKYIIPTQYTVVSTGQLFIKQVEQSEVNARSLFHYKIKDQERAPASKIGFIIGQFPHIHKLNEVPKVKSAYSFFVNQGKYAIFNQQSKFYEKNVKAIIDELQRLLNAQYPFQTLKLVFVPNIFLKNSRKQSIDFSGGVHILDEELLFSKNQQEARHKTYKYLASSLAFDFFGGQVFENTPEDFWLLQGIRENIGNHYKTAKFGTLLYRYHIMQTIESVYKKAKYGIERYPLNSEDIPNPQEFMLNELVYEKSELVMHMIESMIDKVYFERIIRELYHQSRPYVEARVFTKIFKQVCGFKLKQFSENWILSTSCPKLTVQYVYNKKNNSLDLKLSQESAMREHFAFQKYISDSIEMKELMTRPFVLRDSLNVSPGERASVKASLEQISAMDKFLQVEQKRLANRWFEGEVNVMLYLTDGADISTQQQKMSLKMGENEVTINIPLSAKVKKTIQNKKKEYETMQMYEHHHHSAGARPDEDDEDGGSLDNKNSKGGVSNAGGTLIDNNQWKFGLNDLELEDYPIDTKNIFEVKNLESSVLWIRVDPDMEYIRKVSVKQEHNNWLFQLLLEKDIIGQIEAIKQLYKLRTQQQFVYKILQSVSTNEVYYFKVRKMALKYLQKMQTSQFNQHLSHEKFLIKIFNQRNFDENIGFYKSNDFSKVMEYFFDKYLLKTLSKCKEVPFQIKDDIRDLVANGNKALAPQQPAATADGGSISIALALEAPSIKGQKFPREHLLMHSSDQIAQLLLKLLQENDNSENFFDDSAYLKTIIKALGSLDSFKFMPEIAGEIHRQFKLDHIGKFSPQFAITIGSIAGFFNMKKQIHLFKAEKSRHIDPNKEDVEYYLRQIQTAEETLAVMEKELDEIMIDDKWPLEVRFFIARKKIKHSFLYQGNSFIKSLYIQLKVIDNYLALKMIRDAIEYSKALVLFLEHKIERLDWRETLQDSDKAKAINNILWQMICLPFNFLDTSLLYWHKRLYYFLYGSNVPHFLLKSQSIQGIKPETVEYDNMWAKSDQLLGENGGIGMGVLNFREMQAKTRSQKLIAKNLQGDLGAVKGLQQQQQIKIDEMMKTIGDIGPNGQKIDKVDIKLRIVTTQDQGKHNQGLLKSTSDQVMSEKPTWVQPQKQSSGFKITLGQLDPSKVLQSSTQISIPVQSSSSVISIGMGKNLQKYPSGQSTISLKNPHYQSDLSQSKSKDLIQINSAGFNMQTLDEDQQEKLMLMKSISYGSKEETKQVLYNNQEEKEDMVMQDEEGSHTYDEFAEIVFKIDWMQKIWDITGHLWYHEESQAFLDPITFDTFGDDELYRQYISMVEYPIDLFTIKENIKAYKYQNVQQWNKDVTTMFTNCKEFNEESSDIHKSAKKLEKFFHNELKHYGIFDGMMISQLIIR